ncbi:MAG TPA: GMC family oxidoreductase, partial [Povalibacter sp.]|nr:GMC family oxidoreductase [Povalibacter sp.]
MPQDAFDYVIVGSGAGGGTLAARLAESRKRVLVLEAGGDPGTISGDGLPQNYDVPAFHPFASEDPQLSWHFFVDHYPDLDRQRQDPKWREKWYGRENGGDGILYPRASALGGCTAHNAMIFVRPDNADWDHIASISQDPSWSAARMRRHLRQVEACRHRPPWRWLNWLGINPTGHGFSGWLQTERAWPASVATDPDLMRVLLHSVHEALEHEVDLGASLESLFRRHADPNDFRGKRAGVCYTPTSTKDFTRIGTRERLLSVRETHPDYLHIELNALATRVVLDENKRAVAVEYLKGERLYAAHTSVSTSAGEARTATADGEVILAGGAFNTPQLLMLSGIGDPAELARWNIPIQVSLAGVGKNLQDRYEIGVVNRMTRPWEAMRGARFMKGDRLYEEWSKCRARSMYGSNGSAMAVIRRSRPQALPDLFCMALLAKFDGYVP